MRHYDTPPDYDLDEDERLWNHALDRADQIRDERVHEDETFELDNNEPNILPF